MNDAFKKSLNVLNPNDKVQQLRQAFAADGVAQVQPVAAASSQSVETGTETGLKADMIEAMRTIYDPEIPVNIYDLGLIYHIDISASQTVHITMTLTAPGCPVAGEIVAEVTRKARAVPGVVQANVELVFDPPWSKEKMSEAALLELGFL
jgi:FeS assembly SUF system protein